MSDAARPPVFDDDNRLAALRLARGAGIGPILYARLIERFGTPVRALEALPDLAAQAKAKVAPASTGTVEREVKALTKLGGQIVIQGEAAYPSALEALPDAPVVLSVLGEVEILQRPCLAIVGARNASLNGRQLAETFARDLASRHHTIVSGLARGIDTAAHVGALAAGANGGGTIAVMAGGIDHVYPRENEPLYRDIVDSGGAVISEMPLGTAPTARHFPRRNRIVSGLSQGVVVVEAALRSGSLITARLAGEQGREVFAVPGSPADPRCRGSNALIREGAWLIETTDDIVANLPQFSLPQRPHIKETKRTPDKPVFRQEIQPAGAELEVVALLSSGPTAVDEILRQCQTSPSIVAGVLLDLELAGRLERHPGNAVSLIS